MNEIKVGLVVMSTYNYGNQLLNVVLFRLINSLGYKTTCIMPPKDVDENIRREVLYFESSPYDDNDVIFPTTYADLIDLNEKFDIFVVGGDQMFRYDFMKRMHDFAYLDWVSDEKTKICIGTSFGLDFFENTYPSVLGKGQYWLGRFQGLAIRELSGKKILREEFNISEDVIDILDPVLLMGDLFIRQPDNNSMNESHRGTVGAYILDPCEEKEKTINELSHYYELDTDIVFDLGLINAEQHGIDEKRKTVEAWIEMIRHCDFFITDSFHGICVALLLHKKFCVVFQKDSARGYERIKNILGMFGLEHRLVSDFMEFQNRNLYKSEIDYDKIDRIIDYKRHEGIEWIKQHICNKPWRNDDFASLYRQMHWKFNKSNTDFQLIAWGAGQFLNEYKECLVEHNVQYVCDRREELLGREIVPGLICINESELLNKGKVVIVITIDSWDAVMEITKKVYNYKNVIGIMHILELC